MLMFYSEAIIGARAQDTHTAHTTSAGRHQQNIITFSFVLQLFIMLFHTSICEPTTQRAEIYFRNRVIKTARARVNAAACQINKLLQLLPSPSLPLPTVYVALKIAT